jgi:3-deoxy-manno-octulosonate cytidylyltransferase (CMP-KDO synthetase)
MEHAAPACRPRGDGTVIIVGIIPARMAASRFPGKPLSPMCGRPMIEHVYRRSARAKALDRVYVTTPDREIADAAVGFGAPAIMTSPNHVRATDRVAEAAHDLAGDVFINIQGDEPLINPEALDLLCQAMSTDPTLACANLVNRFVRDDDFRNPNQIKVVSDQRHNVLYMSRQPIPWSEPGAGRRLRQLGIIAFSRQFLATFAALPPTPLEVAESIDVLRAIEHGYTVRAVLSPHESFGVDTPDDLRTAEARLATDPLTIELFGSREARR